MRDIEGNRTPVENLSWFLSRTQSLSWNVEKIDNRDSAKILSSVKNSKEYIDFKEKTEKRAKRTRFWRVKGTIIIITTIITACVLGFGIPYVKSFFDPPYTQNMNQNEMIYAFYEAQNELNSSDLTAPLKNTKAPQESEVINLFVTTRTRYATENFNPVVRADEWVSSGKPAIRESAIIYGVDDLVITQVDENVYDATAIWYTPYSYEDEDASEEEKNVNKVYAYKITQRFTFTWNDRGWYNITNIENVSYQFIGSEIVETI